MVVGCDPTLAFKPLYLFKGPVYPLYIVNVDSMYLFWKDIMRTLPDINGEGTIMEAGKATATCI